MFKIVNALALILGLITLIHAQDLPLESDEIVPDSDAPEEGIIDEEVTDDSATRKFSQDSNSFKVDELPEPQSIQIPWSISGTDCDIVQTFGYVLKACRDAQEVRSTSTENAFSKVFDESRIARAFPSKEGSSNAFLLSGSGSSYNVLEMEVRNGNAEIKPLSVIKPKESSSAIVALYFDKEAGYIFIMHANGGF